MVKMYVKAQMLGEDTGELNTTHNIFPGYKNPHAALSTLIYSSHQSALPKLEKLSLMADIK